MSPCPGRRGSRRARRSTSAEAGRRPSTSPTTWRQSSRCSSGSSASRAASPGWRIRLSGGCRRPPGCAGATGTWTTTCASSGHRPRLLLGDLLLLEYQLREQEHDHCYDQEVDARADHLSVEHAARAELADVVDVGGR